MLSGGRQGGHSRRLVLQRGSSADRAEFWYKHYSGHLRATEIEGDQRTRGIKIWRKTCGQQVSGTVAAGDGGGDSLWPAPPGATRLKSEDSALICWELLHTCPVRHKTKSALSVDHIRRAEGDKGHFVCNLSTFHLGNTKHLAFNSLVSVLGDFYCHAAYYLSRFNGCL